MLVSVAYLLSQLRNKRDKYVNNKNEKAVFDREIRVVLIILVIFNIGYVFRSVYDVVFSDNLDQFSTDVMFLFLSIFCDFMPISVLITFHYRNFREVQPEEEENF